MSLIYSEIGKEDIEAVADMAEQYLTHGTSIREAIIREAARNNYYGVKALEDGKMVGFFTYKEGIDFTLPHPELEQKIRALTQGGIIFNCDAIFVNDAYRHKGLGEEMTRRAVSSMRKMGGRYFLFELWIYPNGKIPALNMTEKSLEIIFDERVERFYKDLPRYGMTCPICGANCRCGALIRVFAL